MSDVGDAIQLTFTTAPGADVVMSWTNRDTDEVVHNDIAVAETLDSDDAPTGDFPVTLVGTSAGTWEARFTASGAATNVESYYEQFTDPSGPTPLATVGEYEGLYGSLSLTRQALCRTLLRRASLLLRDSYTTIDAKIAAGTAAAGTIGLAAINMTARVLRNLGGLRSETTGPFTRAYDPDAASGMLEITDSDRALLADSGIGNSVGAKRKFFGTLRTAGGLVPPRRRAGRRWPRGDWS